MNTSPSNGFSPEKSRIEPLSTRGIMAAGSQDARSPHNSNKSAMHVEFIEENEDKQKRERFLTAKYGVECLHAGLEPILKLTIFILVSRLIKWLSYVRG